MSATGRTFTLDPSVRRIDGGQVLIGGSPLRVVRLTDAGMRLIDRISAGEEIDDRGKVAALVGRLLDAGMLHPQTDGPAPYGPSDVTVIIPVRDHRVEATAASAGPVAAVLVVDDGSADAVPSRSNFIVLRRPRNGGPAAARNTALAAVTTPLVAFLDADVTATPGWLDAVLAHFADPRVAAVAPRVMPPAAKRRGRALARYEVARSPLDLGDRPGPVRPTGRISYVPAAALVVRANALAELGGFDESLRYGEDVDLIWRLVAAGHRVRYEPASVVVHQLRPTLRSWMRQRYSYGSSAGPLARRHPGQAPPVAISAWSAAAWAAAAAGHPVIGAALASGSTAALAPKLRSLDQPLPEAVRLAGKGHLWAGRLLADQVTRVWWPLAALAALASRRARRVVAVSVVIPTLLDYRDKRPPLDPIRFAVLRILDDVSYGAGVWTGAWRARTPMPLLPELRNWPGRRPAVEKSSGANGINGSNATAARTKVNPGVDVRSTAP